MWPDDDCGTSSNESIQDCVATISLDTSSCVTNGTAITYIVANLDSSSNYGWNLSVGTGVQYRVPADFEGPHESLATREWMEREDEYRAAARRARRLLIEHLTPGQLREYRVRRPKRRFFLQTPGGHRYMVENGRYGNVYRVKDNQKVECLCLHPRGTIPNEDTALAQKLWLEAGMEDLFKEKANLHDPATWSREILV